MIKRTVMYMNGKKYYVIRDSKGRFSDMQSYKRCMQRDIKRRSKKELAKKMKKCLI